MRGLCKPGTKLAVLLLHLQSHHLVGWSPTCPAQIHLLTGLDLVEVAAAAAMALEDLLLHHGASSYIRVRAAMGVRVRALAQHAQGGPQVAPHPGRGAGDRR